MGPLVFAAVTFALLWVLFILPQQRRVRAHQALVGRLQAGDDVMTGGGIYGTVVDLDDEVVQLEIAEGTVIRVARGAVARRLIEEIDEIEAPPAEEPSAPPTDEPAVEAPVDADAVADPAASET